MKFPCRRALLDSEIQSDLTAAPGSAEAHRSLLANRKIKTMYAGTNAATSLTALGVVALRHFINGFSTARTFPGAPDILALTGTVNPIRQLFDFVSNSISSTMSSNAVLTVNPPPPCLSCYKDCRLVEGGGEC